MKKTVKEFINEKYREYIRESKEDYVNSIALLSAIDSIEYITKKNGRPYAKTEDNILTHSTCYVRHDRGYRWLDVHGAKPCDMWRSHYVATFDAKKPLDELKKDISNYRKKLVAEIEKLEKAVNLSLEDFYNELD